MQILPTVVICRDRRIDSVAAVYAFAAGADCFRADNTHEVVAVAGGSGDRSLTIFTLNDLLSEDLCAALAVRRQHMAGRSAMVYGFMATFTSEQLAWLVIKTLVVSLQPFPTVVGFSDTTASDERPESAAIRAHGLWKTCLLNRHGNP